MMNVYDKDYIEESSFCLGEALDYVANICGMDTGVFLDIFITGGYAERFEKKDPSVVLGMSGTELACRVMIRSGLDLRFPDVAREFTDPSLEYWTGYFLAYLMWYSEVSFKDILECITLEKLSDSIPALLEVSPAEQKDMLISLIAEREKPVKLQHIRKECGYSQRELAELSGVNLRTLQQYEVRAKDINKAAASTLTALCSVLGCKITDIMEN